LARIKPGELCKDYLGRLAASNAIKDFPSLLAAVASLSTCAVDVPKQGMNTALAELTGNQLGEFHAAHTILPIQKAVRPCRLRRPFDSTAEPRVALTFRFPFHTSDARFFFARRASLQIMVKFWGQDDQVRTLLRDSRANGIQTLRDWAH
jgi:hypothetical protein